MHVSLPFYCIIIYYILVSRNLYVGLIICAHVQYIYLGGNRKLCKAVCT
jgi:hypothetical protein